MTLIVLVKEKINKKEHWPNVLLTMKVYQVTLLEVVMHLHTEDIQKNL